MHVFLNRRGIAEDQKIKHPLSQIFEGVGLEGIDLKAQIRRDFLGLVDGGLENEREGAVERRDPVDAAARTGIEEARPHELVERIESGLHVGIKSAHFRRRKHLLARTHEEAVAKNLAGVLKIAAPRREAHRHLRDRGRERLRFVERDEKA